MKPLKFQPLLKSTIWGGSKIITFKHLDVKQENVGESWEISGVPGNESIVADGEMQGKSLNEVVAERKGSFLGEENYKRFGNEFPLLIKFIDANRDLSIQVHPNDEIAKKQGKERGKTEMWYALPCEPDAKLYNGLKMQITPEQYKEMVENDTITDALAQYNVKEGDCFFIPAKQNPHHRNRLFRCRDSADQRCYLSHLRLQAQGQGWQLSPAPHQGSCRVH